MCRMKNDNDKEPEIPKSVRCFKTMTISIKSIKKKYVTELKCILRILPERTLANLTMYSSRIKLFQAFHSLFFKLFLLPVQ